MENILEEKKLGQSIFNEILLPLQEAILKAQFFQEEIQHKKETKLEYLILECMIIESIINLDFPALKNKADIHELLLFICTGYCEVNDINIRKSEIFDADETCRIIEERYKLYYNGMHGQYKQEFMRFAYLSTLVFENDFDLMLKMDNDTYRKKREQQVEHLSKHIFFCFNLSKSKLKNF